MASSASTRMNPGSTTFAAPYRSSSENRDASRPMMSGMRGASQLQNARLRPTWFSHMRDWLSWMPSETLSPSGVPMRPKSSPCS